MSSNSEATTNTSSMGAIVAGLEEPKPRITSKHRGLYYDVKHAAWRVRIFYFGRQRHIGRYKDETMAAQAYDRAAYFLYGTRANLNFRLKDVLADPLDVPASIRQAKEQGSASHAGPRQASTACSTSSSTSSSSPHHSTQSLHCMVSQHQGPLGGAATAGPSSLGPGANPAAAQHFALQQQHPAAHQLMAQQQQAYKLHQHDALAAAAHNSQLVLAQQAGMFMPAGSTASRYGHNSPAWQLQADQQHQQQQVLNALHMEHHPMSQQALHALQEQQQQQHAAGPLMPDVVTSVIAALGLPANSAPPAAVSSASADTSSFLGSGGYLLPGGCMPAPGPGPSCSAAPGGANPSFGAGAGFPSGMLGPSQHVNSNSGMSMMLATADATGHQLQPVPFSSAAVVPSHDGMPMPSAWSSGLAQTQPAAAPAVLHHHQQQQQQQGLTPALLAGYAAQGAATSVHGLQGQHLLVQQQQQHAQVSAHALLQHQQQRQQVEHQQQMQFHTAAAAPGQMLMALPQGGAMAPVSMALQQQRSAAGTTLLSMPQAAAAAAGAANSVMLVGQQQQQLNHQGASTAWQQQAGLHPALM